MKQRFGHLNHSFLLLIPSIFFPKSFLLYTHHQSGNIPLLPNMIFLLFLSFQTLVIITITSLQAMWRYVLILLSFYQYSWSGLVEMVSMKKVGMLEWLNQIKSPKGFGSFNLIEPCQYHHVHFSYTIVTLTTPLYFFCYWVHFLSLER